ncbi:hypothetical protein HOD75_02985 [archaeon]|nr:hypothetical protein [archaeon]MBT4241839.1 hypothetical protein [archaeon]
MSLETKLPKTKQFQRRTNKSPIRKYIPINRHPLKNLHTYIPRNSSRKRILTPDYR